MHNYKNILSWQKSMILVKEIYLTIEKLPDDEKYGLISQIKRSAISIPSNIAEGSGRSSKKDFKRFLEIALSSSFELENQLLLCIELNYFKLTDVNSLMINLTEIQKLIFGLINSMKNEL